MIFQRLGTPRKINDIEHNLELQESLEYNFNQSQIYFSYGYSFYIAWLVLIVNFGSGIAFLMYSKKRKNKQGLDELGMADEPTIMGR